MNPSSDPWYTVHSYSYRLIEEHCSDFDIVVSYRTNNYETNNPEMMAAGPAIDEASHAPNNQPEPIKRTKS